MVEMRIKIVNKAKDNIVSWTIRKLATDAARAFLGGGVHLLQVYPLNKWH